MSVLLRLNRRGATLPLGIIVLALMSVAVAITYARITAERHTGGDVKAQLGAFATKLDFYQSRHGKIIT